MGKPYGDTVEGLLTFRGNPTRTYYGQGPVPRVTPVEAWRYPKGGSMCGTSDFGYGAGPQTVCGMGWTGQPAVFERGGRTWLVFGAWDYGVHFVDADTGEKIIDTFKTCGPQRGCDIIKGSVTIDPDGYPIVYVGSRDNYLRAISFDQGKPVELWRLHAYDGVTQRWNDDWDAAPLVIDDYLFEGGENSNFYIYKLNRSYGADGKVTVDPERIFTTPAWDAQLQRDFPGTAYSIEGSVTVHDNTVYFANSAGLLQGWDLSGVKDGEQPTQVFRFWTGDDTDATIVADEEGFLYVGVEYEKGTARSKQVGQMLKLDPSKPDDPIVWSLPDQSAVSGVWGTPALYEDIVVFITTRGDLLGVDRETGKELWRVKLAGGGGWSSPSPVVIDDTLVIGDCTGHLNAFDLTDTRAEPERLWRLAVGACIEATPAIWKGRIYIGTKAGQLHALEAPAAAPPTTTTPTP